MASQRSTVDFLVDQMADAGVIRSRQMFGEYAIYCNDKVVALVCDDKLFVKQTAAGERLLLTPQLAPPYPGAKMSFYIDGQYWDDRDWLAELIKATAAELPLPKPKSPPKSKKKSSHS